MMLYPEGPDDPRARFPGVEWAYTRDAGGADDRVRGQARRGAGRAEHGAHGHRLGVASRARRFAYRSARPGRHHRLILAAMREKLRQNPEVRRVLLATGDLVLRPDHHEEAGRPPGLALLRDLDADPRRVAAHREERWQRPRTGRTRGRDGPPRWRDGQGGRDRERPGSRSGPRPGPLAERHPPHGAGSRCAMLLRYAPSGGRRRHMNFADPRLFVGAAGPDEMQVAEHPAGSSARRCSPSRLARAPAMRRRRPRRRR